MSRTLAESPFQGERACCTEYFKERNPMLKTVASLISFFMLIVVSGCHLNCTVPRNRTPCFPRESCNGGFPPVSEDRTCQCDDYCSYYNDCCWDADTNNVIKPLGEYAAECHETSPNRGYYVISYCKKGWKDKYIEKKCQCRSDSSDPLLKLFATSSETSITYRNYFCAICNDDSADLIFWTIAMECPTLENGHASKLSANVSQNLTFNPYCREWGIWMSDGFHICKLNLKQPDGYEDDVFRPCFPNIKSHCPPNWKDDKIRDKCGSYSAVVFSPGGKEAFRNIYCAMCNYVDAASMSCSPPRRRIYSRQSSFTALLTVERGRCTEGEIYDPYFKRCRNVVCGFLNRMLVRGRCMRRFS